MGKGFVILSIFLLLMAGCFSDTKNIDQVNDSNLTKRAPGTNLIQNGSFEAGLASWSITNGITSSEVIHSGTSAIKDSKGVAGDYRQTFITVPGRNYVASVWLNIISCQNASWGGMRFSKVDYDWKNYNSSKYYTQTNGWVKIELQFTAISTQTRLLLQEFSGGLDIEAYWDDVEVYDISPVTPPVVTNQNNKGIKALIFRHQNASSDHIESYMKVLNGLGVEYEFGFDKNSATTPPSVNRIDLLPSTLLDNAVPKYSVIIHAGGNGNNSAISQQGQANLREYSKNGGNYLGICMGAWNACNGWYYTSNPGNQGIGLIGEKLNGDRGDLSKYSIHGYLLNADVLGGYSLNMAHPINKNLTYSKVSKVRYAGSGYFDLEKTGFWSQSEWNRDISVIAYNSDYPASGGGDTNFGNTVNGKPTAIEYVKPADSFGRTVVTATHPEHTPESMPYFYEMLKYTIFGDSKTDNSGNKKPSVEFGLDKMVYTGTSTVNVAAKNIYDTDGKSFTAMWCSDKRILTVNGNNDVPIIWDKTVTTTTNSAASTITLSPNPAKPYRVMLRLKDDGAIPRICERTRLVAVNNQDPDNSLVNFDFTVNSASVITVKAPYTVNFRVFNLSGDTLASTDNAFLDFGDGEYKGIGSVFWGNNEVNRSCTYIAPGTYTASAALKDNDNCWNVKTVVINVVP